MSELKRIGKLYLDGELMSITDEKGAGGYWDLAGELADELLEKDDEDWKYEQLQEGFYQVFQRVLVRGEMYE